MVQLDLSAHLARPRACPSPAPLGPPGLGPGGVSGQRGDDPSSGSQAGLRARASDSVPLTVGAAQLCPGLWTPDAWSYVPPHEVCGEQQAEE